MEATSASRREFLMRAAFAGGGVAASTILPDVARAAVPDVNDDATSVVDPGFVAGNVKAIDGNGYVTVIDPDRTEQTLQVGSGTSAWRDTAWGASAPRVGDCVYARGERNAEGVLDVERVWSNIGSFPATLKRASAAELLVDLGQEREEIVRVSERTQIQTKNGTFDRRGAPALPGEVPVQIVEASDPETGAATASRVLVFDGSAATAGEDDPIIDPRGCRVWTGLTTWFCCQGGGCGRCGSAGAGGGACGGCRSDQNHMAWPKLQTGCGPYCSNCCLPGSFPRFHCGKLLNVSHACQGGAVNVRVQDCGPTVRCVSEVGGCISRTKVKFDLTPCAFSQLKNLDAGIFVCNVADC